MVLAIHEDGNKEDSCQAESFMRFSSIYISLFLLHKTHTSIKVLRYFPVVCRQQAHTHTYTHVPPQARTCRSAISISSEQVGRKKLSYIRSGALV